MLEIVNRLSVESGAVVVAVVSALMAIIWLRCTSQRLAWLLALLAPFVVASSLYSVPVWRGADPLEFAAWAPLFIGPWYLAGAVASSFVVFLGVVLRRHRARFRQRSL